MISLSRLRWDGWIQITLGAACLLAFGTEAGRVGRLLLWLLWIWQVGSALELYLDYRHHNRMAYVLLLPVTVLLAYIAAYWNGIVLVLATVIYGIHTLRDYTVVLRRPRSFWDL